MYVCKAVADPGEGHGGGRPPLFLDQNEAEKTFFDTAAPPPPPPLSEYLDLPLNGVGKSFAKFRTGKFRLGIAFTICKNQFHLPENDREGLELASKRALKKWDTNFPLEYSIWKNRTTFSDVPLLPEIFRLEDPKSRV